MRAEFQVLIIPFIKTSDNDVKFAIFKRKSNGIWQFISGGGEDDEQLMETVKREFREETGIISDNFFILKTQSMVPISLFKAHRDKKGLYVIPEYCFALDISDADIVMSDEHTDFRIVAFDEANSLLQYDSNKTALWELNERIKADDLHS